MNQVTVLPVKTNREKRIFLTFPWQIYRGDPLWVPPLLPERRKSIDPQKGAFFTHGEAEFFIAWRDGKPLGTICAAEDKEGNRFTGNKDCLWGFFECINEYAVAQSLWECATRWGKERGLGALFGPFNLDYEDAYGILVEGRTRRPAMLCGHTPGYYLDFVERYGFQPGRDQNIAFGVDLMQNLESCKRLARIADRVRQQKRFTIRTPDFKQWENEIDPLLGLLNTALVHLEGFIPWRHDDLRALLAQFKDFADPDLILFAEENGRTIGFFPGVPDLNEVFIHVNGLRYPWNYADAWLRMRRKIDSLSIKSILVHPDYWGTGAVILLMDEMQKRAKSKGYRFVDLSLTSVDNPKTPLLAAHMGAAVYKRYQVYRKFF